MEKILVTFDYELFLGVNSGTPSKCIIKPVDDILKILKSNKIKAVFFVDTLYLVRLNEIAGQYATARNDFDQIENQLKVIIEDGHYVFPHLHPHWLDARYDAESNEWCLENSRYYKFSSLSREMQQRTFDQSIELLESITTQTTKECIIDGYRAGGWCIQPTSDFRPHFLKHGIRHEFSVRKGVRIESDAHCFDFRNAPGDDIYSFEHEVTEQEPLGNFIEYTISYIALGRYENWVSSKLNRIQYELGMRAYGDGRGLSAKVTKSSDENEVDGLKCQVASIEGLNFITYFKYKKALKEKKYFHFISHPKAITPFELKLFGHLLKSVNKDNIETDFRKFFARTPGMNNESVANKNQMLVNVR